MTLGAETSSSFQAEAHLRPGGKACLPSQREDIFRRELDGELILFDPITNVTHRLNQTAAFIYFFCDGRTGVDQLLHEYRETFLIESEISERDVKHVLMSLEKLALVKYQP